MDSDPNRRRQDRDESVTDGEGNNLTSKAFDRWFRRQIHRIYDETMAEPLPDHLDALLKRFPSRRETPDDEGPRRDDGDERG